MAGAGAHAIRAGVATADDHHVFAFGTQLLFELVARVDLVLLGQELHGEMDTGQIAAGRGQVARLLSAAGQQHRVKILLQLCWADGFLGPIGDLGAFGQFTHHHTGSEGHAFGLELLGAAVDVCFLHLEVGNAIA